VPPRQQRLQRWRRLWDEYPEAAELVREALADRLAAEASELLSHYPSDDRAALVKIAAAREIRLIVAEIDDARKEAEDARP
jgi:hypothetical protein